ncbi:MAG TPA: hypothetical protein PLD73_01410 [Candidatus Hydrogenedentes bacterium]|nr:hypothetical protein [Candidatus Hydrogenedentota bacterium]
MANVLTILGDRRAAFSPSVLAMQSDNLTPLTVTFDADALDLYGTNPTLYIDWLLPDATDLYTGPYTPAASVAVTIPDTVLAQEGTLRAQVRVSDDEGQVWRSMEAHTVLRRALTADEPAGALDPAPDYWGAYDNAQAYVTGNVVYYQGSSYICIADSTGNLPTDTDYWQIIAMGAYTAAVEGGYEGTEAQFIAALGAL